MIYMNSSKTNLQLKEIALSQLLLILD